MTLLDGPHPFSKSLTGWGGYIFSKAEGKRSRDNVVLGDSTGHSKNGPFPLDEKKGAPKKSWKSIWDQGAAFGPIHGTRSHIPT
mmetsp:Transcript_56323/g.92569  ORF Transcript_56323/g.92569 Transcript_56323/m.92569 type:complete len:84 (+) Transcript_56323:1273-1524(+)